MESQEAFEREAARWDRAIEAAGMDGFPQDYFRALIAMQRLAGAQSREEAVQVVRAVWDADSQFMSDPPMLHPGTLNALLRLLAMLYPPQGRAYWGGLSDPLLTSLLEALEGLGEEFLTHILLSERLTARQRFSCLRLLSLTFPKHPHRLERAAEAVRARPDLLYQGALQVMPEMPLDTRRRWQATALDDHEGTPPGPDPVAAASAQGPTPETAAEDLESVADERAVPSTPLRSPVVPPHQRMAEEPQSVSPARPAARPRGGLAPVRDYLGFDIHGWRRVLTAVAVLGVAVVALLLALA
ncbi:hypothetical protein ACEZCY_35780 [Streptacidiphilus sp. N1-12]|uniref:Uncharacterized protein n=1 Tax=Streptacidiphilus alkalitolerans TaxID=3342712 RepID=A0ABV6WR98_9ACTN